MTEHEHQIKESGQRPLEVAHPSKFCPSPNNANGAVEFEQFPMIQENLREKQAKAKKKPSRPNIVQPRLTESELYYLYKHLYPRKEQK